jgi:predicted nucleic acid-binding protein
VSIDHRTVVFFDASCLVAAAGSPSGGSAFLLNVCADGFLRGAVSQTVLLETERNVAAKLGPDALGRYHTQVAAAPLLLVAAPTPPQQVYASIVGEKDNHVVAAALAAEATFLVTLDQLLAKRVNEAGLSIRALAPGDFIKTVLSQHSAYPSMR